MRWKGSITVLSFVLFFVLPMGCGVYTFTGASVSPAVKTISVQNFYNNAPLGPGDLGNTFTEKLKDYFLTNTSLVLIGQNGDIQVEGTIEDFSIVPVAPRASGSEQGIDYASLNRVSITIQVNYFNSQDPNFNFEKRNFAFFKDFDPNTQDYTTNEQRFVDEITDQIVIDIFNKTIANW